MTDHTQQIDFQERLKRLQAAPTPIPVITKEKPPKPGTTAVKKLRNGFLFAASIAVGWFAVDGAALLANAGLNVPQFASFAPANTGTVPYDEITPGLPVSEWTERPGPEVYDFVGRQALAVMDRAFYKTPDGFERVSAIQANKVTPLQRVFNDLPPEADYQRSLLQQLAEANLQNPYAYEYFLDADGSWDTVYLGPGGAGFYAKAFALFSGFDSKENGAPSPAEKRQLHARMMARLLPPDTDHRVMSFDGRDIYVYMPETQSGGAESAREWSAFFFDEQSEFVIQMNGFGTERQFEAVVKSTFAPKQT